MGCVLRIAYCVFRNYAIRNTQYVLVSTNFGENLKHAGKESGNLFSAEAFGAFISLCNFCGESGCSRSPAVSFGEENWGTSSGWA